MSADSPFMPADSRVLVVGGGTSGNALTVLLRRAGVAVELVEARSDWNATAGSGITLQGNALRVLRDVGVWEQLRTRGYAFDSLGIRSPDGTLLHVADDIRTGGTDLPATVGTQRPRLQQLLIEQVRASGAEVRFGTGVTSLTQDAGGVDVFFSDGTTGRYDLVVGADGVHSTVRELIGVPDRPEPTGLAIRRASAPRPTAVTRTEIVYSGPCHIAGYCPTGEDTLYAYLVEPNRDRATLDPDAHATEMHRLAEGYAGPWQDIRASLTDPRAVNYTWFDHLLVDGPWHRGRVVLVGDAVHCCPPTLAQGAALSLEDTFVLATLLTTRDEWDEQLLTDYRNRRYPRVRPVVDASMRINNVLLDGADWGSIPEIMAPALATLQEAP